jgi:hypothetical protein
MVKYILGRKCNFKEQRVRVEEEDRKTMVILLLL